MFEFTCLDQDLVSNLELTFKRDERVMRWLTVKLDKHSILYAEKRRERLNKKEKKEVKN